MLGVTLLIVCIIFVFVKRNKFNIDYWKKKNVPQVNGILPRFVKGKQSLPEIYKEIYDAHPKSPYVGLFLGTKPALILRDLENVQAVLHGDFQSFYARGLVLNTTDILADNLLFAEDYNRWKLIRNKVVPIFTTQKLKNMFYIMETCAKEFIDHIDENPQILNDPFNAMYIYTSACVGFSIFGIDKETRNSMESPFSEMAQALKPDLKFILKFALMNLSPKLFKFMNFKFFGKYEVSFIRVFRNAMNRRRKNKKICHDFIDECLKLEDEGFLKDFVTGYKMDITVQLLGAQAFNFIIGGIDTSVNATHFTLLELSNNPKILQKVHDEIDETFNKNGGKLTFEDIDNLKYMEKVICEAVRKYPPIGSIQRRCCKDAVLPVGGVKVEKDTVVVIPIYAIHRDAKYFPDPHIFDPERFSTENVSQIIKYSYMPFGEGKRTCIGPRFARIEIKTCLAWLLRKYTIKEQAYAPNQYMPSIVSLRAPKAYYEIIPRVQI